MTCNVVWLSIKGQHLLRLFRTLVSYESVSQECELVNKQRSSCVLRGPEEETKGCERECSGLTQDQWRRA